MSLSLNVRILTYPKYSTPSERYTFYFRNCWYLNQIISFQGHNNNGTIKQKCSQIPVEKKCIPACVFVEKLNAFASPIAYGFD